MPKTSLVQAMLVSLMRFFSSSLMESLPPKKRGRFFRIDLVDCFFADAAADFFSVVAESNGLFPEAFLRRLRLPSGQIRCGNFG